MTSPLCGQNLSKLIKKNSTLKGLCNTCNIPLAEAKTAVKALTQKPESMIKELINSAKDKIFGAKNSINGKIKGIEKGCNDALKGRSNSLIECFVKNKGLGSVSAGRISVPSMGMGLLDELLNFGFFEDAIDNLLGSGMSALNELIPVGLIDNILGLAGCLDGCSGASGIDMTDFVVSAKDSLSAVVGPYAESMLNSVGLDISGKTNMNLPVWVAGLSVGLLNSSIQEYSGMMGDAHSDMINMIRVSKRNMVQGGASVVSKPQNPTDFSQMSGQSLIHSGEQYVGPYILGNDVL